MKALGYLAAHSLQNFQIKEFELKDPEIKSHEILVQVKAISINPVDYKIRQNRSSKDQSPVVLGWDASGVVVKVGADVSNFRTGDEVYYAGDLNKAGSYAELQAVDARIVALKPKSLSYSEAAALPLTGLTAYEALIENGSFDLSAGTNTLIIGGAGGVGSMAIQIIKALSKTRVIATASRPESKEWCLRLGADNVIDHNLGLQKEAENLKISDFDGVFSTTNTLKYLTDLQKLIRPFGSLFLIDDPDSLDIRSFKTKSIRVGWEFMFTKTMFGYRESSQGKILAHIAELVDQNKVVSTIYKEYKGLTPENIYRAHSTLETGSSVGKIAIALSPEYEK